MLYSVTAASRIQFLYALSVATIPKSDAENMLFRKH